MPVRDARRVKLAFLMALAGSPTDVGCGGDDVVASGTGGGGTVGTTSTSTYGGVSTAGGADSADGTDGTGPFTPDEQVCEAVTCDVGADCCVGVQASSSLPADKHACPSSTYPNNWSCHSGQCVNAGCQDDADCGQLAGFAAMICRVIDQGGPGYCVRYCDDDSGCDPDNLHMKCTGVAYEGNTKYCEQYPAP